MKSENLQRVIGSEKTREKIAVVFGQLAAMNRL